MTRLLLLAFLASALNPEASAASAARASARFLLIGVGARQTAMGEAAAGLADDVYAVHYNPAGLAQLLQNEAGFLHAQYVEGINYEYLAYAQPTARWGTVAGQLTMLQYGKIKGYDENDAPTGDVSASDLAFTAGWGGSPFSKTLPRLRLGGSAKVVRETLASRTGTAFAADLGAQHPILEEARYTLTGGLAVRNVGSKLKFVSEGYDLPRVVVGGIGFKGLRESVAAGLDVEVPQYGDLAARFGAEAWTRNTLALRLGYHSGSDLGPGISGGFGVKFRSFQLDYSIAPFGDFGYVHRGGLTFRFGGRIGGLYDQGVTLMNQDRCAEALEVFTRVLTAEPDHRGAVLRMRECQKSLSSGMREEKK